MHAHAPSAPVQPLLDATAYLSRRGASRGLRDAKELQERWRAIRQAALEVGAPTPRLRVPSFLCPMRCLLMRSAIVNKK